MKKIFFLLLIAAFGSISTNAQKISSDKVPAAVTSSFKTKFPEVVNAEWEMEKADYEASFKKNGVEMSANFDNEGKWLETETEIKVSALPAAVSATLKKDFADYKVDEACKVESVKDGNCYEVEVEKGKESFDVLISTDGKVLSKTKEEEKDKEDKE